MNVTDAKEPIECKGDMLEEIFSLQSVLASRFRGVEEKNGLYAPNPESINLNHVIDQERLKVAAFRVIAELIEATECLKNKAWKQTNLVTDLEHFYEEIADTLHFFVEFCIDAGLNSKTLYKYYMKKHEVNNWRIDTKY